MLTAAQNEPSYTNTGSAGSQHNHIMLFEGCIKLIVDETGTERRRLRG